MINKIKETFINSKFDLKYGFWQIPLTKESRPWIVFITYNGRYEWTVMPFGLKNASQVFQKIMDDIFRKYSYFIITYIDDILVFNKFVKEHV